MHTGSLDMRESFKVVIDGAPAGVESLMEDWTVRDRFGIVVREPWGSLGASLLFQVAINNFFYAKPTRRTTEPEYPEIYVFHDGGPHGDHSMFDFWPPRKEIFVRAGDAQALLAAINSHGITRLAVPDGTVGPIRALQAGITTWADMNSAKFRISSCFAYDPNGRTRDADVTLSSDHPRIEEDVNYTFDPLSLIKEAVELPDDQFYTVLPGEAEPPDYMKWVNLVGQRMVEVPDMERKEIRMRRRARIASDGGATVETYRRLSIQEVFGLLAGAAVVE